MPGRLVSYLRTHPILCLFLLTPGIPEYLTSSSPLNAIFLNPPQFLFQLGVNSALYLPGALLVREAMVRWRKGWPTVLLLGAAYGILEEGIALSTLYNPDSHQVGQLGVYGHWLGVSWVWTVGIVLVHMVYSIALPIMLLGLALPETKGRSLLSPTRLKVAFAVLGVDVVFLSALVTLGMHFWMGWPAFFGSWLVIVALAMAGRLAPNGLGIVATGSRPGTVQTFFVGLGFFLSILFPEYFLMALHLPPLGSILTMLASEGLLFVWTARRLPKADNERQKVALALGILLPICVFGVVAELPLAASIAGVIAMAWFLRRLWTRYPPVRERAPYPLIISQVPP